MGVAKDIAMETASTRRGKSETFGLSYEGGKLTVSPSQLIGGRKPY